MTYDHKKFGKSPIFFEDEAKRGEWDAMPLDVKESIKRHLHETTQKIGTQMSIELLCHVYNELSEKIDKIQKLLDKN